MNKTSRYSKIFSFFQLIHLSEKQKVLLLLLFYTLFLHAAPHLTHNYAYRYFTTRDGLVQMQVLSAFQDKDGYMWFGKLIEENNQY